MSKQAIQRKHRCEYCQDFTTAPRVKVDIRVMVGDKLVDDFVGLVDVGCGLIAERYGFLKKTIKGVKQNKVD